MAKHRSTIILVLGMHRSGTSAFTRTLNLLGAEVPGTLHDPHPQENPLGFWESKELMGSHERFLAAVGSGWDDLRPLPDRFFDHPAALHCRDEVLALLGPSLTQSPILVIKDPRICRLLPLWRKVGDNLGADIRAVLTVRNPIEVALSLLARNGFDRARSLMLWLGHFLAAERGSRGLPRCFAAYDDFLRQPEASARHLAARLGCFDDQGSARALPEIAAFWRQELRHHCWDDQAVLADDEVASWVRQTFDWALQAVADPDLSPAPLDHVWDELDHAMAALGTFLDPARLSHQHHLETELTKRDRHIEALERDLAIQASDVVRQNQQLAELGGQLACKQSEIVGILQAQEQRQREWTEVMETLSARDDEIIRLQQTQAVKDTEIAGLNSTRFEQTAVIASLTTVRDHQESQVKSLQAELAGLETRLTDLHDQLQDANADNTLLRTRLAEASTEIHTRQQSYDRLLTQLRDQQVWQETLVMALAAKPRTWRDELWCRHMLRGIDLGDWFDPVYYCRTMPQMAGSDPLIHFLRHGWKQGGNPSPRFDVGRYLAANPDVRADGINPLLHYLRYGRAEGRQAFAV